MSNFLGQSQLGSILINELAEAPEAMVGVIQKYLDYSPDILLHGDIQPLFEDVVVFILKWITEGKRDLVQDFLDRLQALLLSHPKFQHPDVSFSPEEHLLHKMSTLVNILGIALRITLNPLPRPTK